MVGYAVHKWGELAVVGHVVPIAGGEGIGYDEAAFGTRHSNVELAGVFLVLLFGGVALVRIAFGGGIEDDDIVEFESLRLVYGGNVDTFVKALAVAEVAFFHRADFQHIAVNLFNKCIRYAFIGE